MDEDKKDDNVEKVKVTIEIPKNTVALIVNHLIVNCSEISILNSQYDSDDIDKLIEDSEKMGE